MNAFTKFAAAAALAFTGLAAAPASATTIINFAQYQQKNAGDTLVWTQSAAKTGGTLQDIGDPTVIFRLWDTDVAHGDPVEVLATLQFAGVVDDGNPAQTLGGFQVQQGLHGTFSFTSQQAFTRNGVDYAAGANLLSGAFSGGVIMGVATGAMSVDPLAGGSATYLSDVFNAGNLDFETFTISLNAIHRGQLNGLTHLTGKSLSNFTATTTGQFGAAVPEPGAWALMIVGFAGAGAMLRRRRAGPGAVALRI